jgi:hypothetical protein
VQAEVLGALLDHIRRQVRHLLYLCGSQDRFYFGAATDGYGSGAAWGPRLVRGGTRADHARTDRSRARQVRRALLYPYAVVQGIYFLSSQRPVWADKRWIYRSRSLRDTL